MPVTPTYPGVYIEEIPSGVHTIIGVATSITAFLGRTERGLANKATVLTSFADYERSFGSLNPDFPVCYAARDFFNNGGSQAIIVRIFRDAAQEANAQAAAAVAKAVTDLSDNAAINDLTKAADDKAKEFADKPSKSGADAVNTAVKVKAEEANVTVQAVKDAAKTAADGEAAKLDDPYNGCAIYQKQAKWNKKDLNLEFTVAGPGTWGEDFFVMFDQVGITQEVATRYGLSSEKQLFNLQVYGNRSGLSYNDLINGPPLEIIRNVTVWENAGERRIDRVLESQSNLLRYTGDFTTQEADAAYSDINAAPPDNPNEKPADPLFVGGLDSSPLDQAAYAGSLDKKTGFNALEDTDLFNIMCVPPDQRGGSNAKEIYDDALNYCVRRRAVLIVDPPDTWNNRVTLLSNPANKLANDINLSGEKARNAFLYYPRIKMADPMRGGQYDVFPACGIIAGVFARTDTQRGVWKAPAGLDASLGGVFLEVPLTDRENGILNPLGINCLRSFPVGGKVVWGSRTLRGADQLADEYKYLPVRRTALFIEESLYRGTQWVVFQPNDEPLWAQIRLNVGAFMNDLFRRGAFQGSKPQDAYFVRCDHSTTTQNDIDRGIVNILVGFAPLKPAEFVVIQLQQIAGQIQV